MTVDHQELNKVVSTIHVAMPNIATSSDTLAMTLGVYRDVLDLANDVSSISLAIESQDQFAFM